MQKMLLFVWILTAACMPQNAKKQISFSLGGSTTIEPVMQTAIETLAKEDPNTRIVYEAQGSSAGVRGLLNGSFVLAGLSRELTPEEGLQGILAYPFALDAILIVANGSVDLDSISLEEAAKIFSGKIMNWKALGGPDRRIETVEREEGSGSRASFKELTLAPFELDYRMESIVSDSNGSMVNYVGATPYAIGYVGLGYEKEILSYGGRILKIDGVDPTPDHVISGRYPLARFLYLASKGPMPPGSAAAKLYDWLFSQEGANIIKEAGFLPVQRQPPPA